MRKGEVLSNKEVAHNTFIMSIRTDLNHVLPGQFVRIKTNMFLPRPFSVMEFEEGVLKIMYKVVGRGTEFMKGLKEHDEIFITGPHGKAVPDFHNKRILLIGGGVGVAPLIFIYQHLNRDNNISILWGLKHRDEFVREMERYIHRVVYEEDGLLVTDVVETDKFDIFIACGPEGMLKALQSKIRQNMFFLMEGIMGCGTGLCYGCGVKTKHGYRRVCREGPVFKAEEVIFD